MDCADNQRPTCAGISGFRAWLEEQEEKLRRVLAIVGPRRAGKTFLIANEKFSHSPRKRLMNPKKVYLVDTGFAALGRSFSENRGRILENLVAVELHRRGEEVSYFKGRHECDFVVSRDRRPVEAIQVCWELNPRNEKRELAGLTEATRTLGVERLSLLTFNQRNSIEIDNKSVTVLPVWEWLLHPERGPGAADHLET